MSTILDTMYNPRVDIKKGEHKLVFIGGKPVAYLKKHSFSVKTETESLASKFSDRFEDKLGGNTSYSISCDAFVAGVDLGFMSATALRHMAYSGQDFFMEVAVGNMRFNDDGTRQVEKGDVLMKGRVIITEVGEESEKGSYETLSLSLEGTGALFDADGKEYGSKEILTRLALSNG